jgi:hypothetical protein
MLIVGMMRVDMLSFVNTSIAMLNVVIMSVAMMVGAGMMSVIRRRVMLSVILLSFVVLSVALPSDILLGGVAPLFGRSWVKFFGKGNRRVFLSQACHSFAKDFVSMVFVHRHIEFSGLYYKHVTIVIGAPSVVSK